MSFHSTSSAMSNFTSEAMLGGPSAELDTLQALISLGYKPAEAEKCVKKAVEALGADATTEALLRKALG
jgi:holliday junction DNA helicase RuvA